MYKKLRETQKAVEAVCGKGSVRILSDRPEPVQVVRTGSVALDIALGIGGFPRGRIAEIYGPEQTGKSTIALCATAEAQFQYDESGTAYLDPENAMSPDYMVGCGVNIDETLFAQPESGEEGFKILHTLLDVGDLSIITVDSVSAMVPEDEIDAEMDKDLPGLHARLMGRGIRKTNAKVKKAGTAVLFINQLRDKVGVQFGNPETTTGGKALRFFSSVRLDVRVRQILADTEKGEDGKVKKDSYGKPVKGVPYGIRVGVKVVKNKLAPPGRICEFEILYGHGINARADLVDTAVAQKVLTVAVGKYSLGKCKLGNRDTLFDSLSVEPELVNEIMMETYKSAGIEE